MKMETSLKLVHSNSRIEKALVFVFYTFLQHDLLY